MSQFSKDSYEAWVREAGPKGAVVVAAVAMDLDNSDGEIAYEIIDGNVDGAFVMSPASSSSSSTTVPAGTILTNTVLDREIKDEYELTVSATDSGVPPLVGLATVVVRVIDENDNRPHFAPIRPIKINRGKLLVHSLLHGAQDVSSETELGWWHKPTSVKFYCTIRTMDVPPFSHTYKRTNHMSNHMGSGVHWPYIMGSACLAVSRGQETPRRRQGRALSWLCR